MGNAADLIRAIAALAWPLLIAAILWTQRRHLAAAFRRARRFRLPGGFEVELDRLAENVQSGIERVPSPEEIGEFEASGPPEELAPRLDPRMGAGTQVERTWADIARILEEAATSPKLALMALAAEIEREAHERLASYTDPSDLEGRSVSYKLSRLDLAPDLRPAIEQFRRVRNTIVHGHEANEDDILRAIDAGSSILEALKRIPRVVRRVYAPRLPIYSDPNGEHLRAGVHGVVLESTTPDREPERQVFPTTKTHFQRGQAVAWEWDLTRIWPESWYRDPDTNEIKYAWTESGEFIGRPLTNI